METQAQFIEIGHLQAHNDQVTVIQTGHTLQEHKDPQVLITASKDRTILVWKINSESKEIKNFAQPVQSLLGHSDAISDLALSFDNNYLISSSWDKTMRLWNLSNGSTLQTFQEDGHSQQVLSCAISSDGRLVLSSGADKQIKLWNTMGSCKLTIQENNHTDAVSKIRFVPNTNNYAPLFASIGFDGFLKIWNIQTFTIRESFRAFQGQINALTISSIGNLMAVGGKNKQVKVFSFSDTQNASPVHEAIYDTQTQVKCLSFNPNPANPLIAIGTQNGWEIWAFGSDKNPIIFKGKYKVQGMSNYEQKYNKVTSIAWNTLGNRIFIGFSNGVIKIYENKSN